tara:strand:- start:1762 stop:2346 length:585 start_codon:yes stop_codon:yes gene_type:complete
MTPREYIEESQRQAEQWHIPLFNKKQWSLGAALSSMDSFKLRPEDVPLIIKLVENPKYDIGLFAGSVSLGLHDCVHLLLGRGLMPKDEAFVIGYTMGSTKKMRRWRRNLFMFCAKYLYPEGYKFGEEERFVFNLAVKAGSLCETDLSTVDFSLLKGKKISQIRTRLKIDINLLKSSYEVEKKCFPNSPESQRLL